MPPWPPQEPPHHDIDAAIDRAVRDVMNVDADRTFRARVFARLERRAARRFGWPAYGITAAGVAALLAVTVMRSPEPATLPAAPAGEARLQATQTAPAAPPAVVSPASTPRPEPPRTTALRPLRRQAVRNVTQELAAGALMAASIEDPPPSAVDAPRSIEPIEVNPIGPRPLSPSAIVIAPLAHISELQIAPLLPQVERD